jgi:tRNA A37 threonylcarbamoyladenosine dehydratase
MEDKTARLVFLDRISIFGKAYTFRMDKNAKIVVCGAGGFIGGHLVADLLRQGCANIRAVDLKPVSRKPIAGSTAK